MIGNEEELRRLLREEEEEDREMGEYDLRLEDMLEGCSEYDRSIRGLIDEQREALNILRMRRNE